METIIKKCKAGVYLEANKYRDYYETIPEAIEDANRDDKTIDDKLAERMIKTNQFISLQFYPDTPIGFYKVYGTSFDEVIEKALAILES